MVSAWVIHVKNFASRNNMSYGCAMTDARCKKEYHETKKKSARDPVKFTPKTKKQKPVKKIFKAIVEDSDDEVPTPPTSDEEDEPKKDMPEVLQKMIQDFVRPRPKKMETKEILARPFNIGFYQFGEDRDKDEALLNEFDGTTREILKYMYYFPKKELFIELYQVTDDIPDEFKGELDKIDRFYIMPEVNNFMYSFDTLGYVVDSRYADTDVEGDYDMMEVDVRNKENLKLYANKWKKPLEKAKAEVKKEKKGRDTFEKKVRFKDDWIYVFGKDKKADRKFIEQFERNKSPFTVIQLDYDFYLQKKPVKGKVFEDESGDIIYTIEVDNYAYDDIEDITIEFDGEEEGDEFIKMDFDLSNEHNAKLDQKAKENFKKTSKRFKDQKAKEKSKKEKPKEEKPKEKEKPKDKELVEKAKKQLAIMNRARDRGIEMDEDMREDLEAIVKGSGLPKSKFDWFM